MEIIILLYFLMAKIFFHTCYYQIDLGQTWLDLIWLRQYAIQIQQASVTKPKSPL